MASSGWDDARMGNERDELMATLDKHRGFLRHTVQGLTDEQAARRTTVSELCLGGLVKHVGQVEENWAAFIERGPSAFPPMDEASFAAHAAGFRMADGETLASILERYDQI